MTEETFSDSVAGAKTRTADTLPTQIALGWIASLLVQTIAMLMMVVDSLLREVLTNFRSLHSDPGSQGLRTLVYLVAFYALMPVYVFAVNRLRPRALRWVGVGAAFLGALYVILHHLSHVYFGQRQTFTSNVLDLTLHVISLWIIVNSIRWARDRVAVPAAAPLYTTASATAS